MIKQFEGNYISGNEWDCYLNNGKEIILSVFVKSGADMQGHAGAHAA